MAVKVEAKVTTEIKAHFHKGDFKTHPADYGEWYGDETCKAVDLNDAVADVQLPEGEYKITITVEKVN